MRPKPILITIVLLLLCCKPTLADTFIVTSNADNGPGTLRDAIEKANANGTAVTDLIHFNIPEPVYNLRIIELITELPAISSNTIIDGSTQPGAAYGTTDARICLRKTTYAPSFSMIKIENAQHVQIYGLHLYYGYWQGIFIPPGRSDQLFGVNITSSSDILIGEPGKGNVINGVVHGIYSNSDGCSNIKIRSNYLGHGAFYANTADDVDDVIFGSVCGITLGNVKNIFIGGPLPAEGNVFGSTNRAINIDSRHATGNGLISIQQNIFSRLYDKVTIIQTSDFWDKYVSIGRSRNNPVSWTANNDMDYQVELLDNDIPDDVGIGSISGFLTVFRNKFIYDGREDNVEGKLSIGSIAGGIIGGDDPTNANYFLYKKPDMGGGAITVHETGPITILKNIFTCNSTYGSTIQIYDAANNVPFAQVDITTPGSVTGRATPNSRIDLYYDDECSACEGKVYLATVQSGTDGSWTYSGTINGTVIATATKNGYTSMFSSPTFDFTARKVVQPVCGLNNGSITGITTEGAESYFWINFQTGDTASKTIDLLNAGPGEYMLFAAHGGTCISPLGHSILLEDVTPAIFGVPDIGQPTCGLPNGHIQGLRHERTQNSKLEWKNEWGQVISNQVDIFQLPPGKYTLYATDLTVGCTAVSPTYELINQNGPSLNTGAVQIIPTTCGKANGSIKGITASNVTGTPFTQWVNAANQPVGTDYDLSAVPAGTYRFKFKDQGGCDTIFASYTINALTSFTPITVTRFTSKDGICNRPDASVNIHSFSVNPADFTFRWVDAGSGVTVGTNGNTITGLHAGTYQLFATDKNNCESMIFSATVKVLPEPTYDYSSLTIVNDQCNLNKGAITSLKINGLTSPASYAWFDHNNTSVGGNSSSLQNMPAGTYYLHVTDGGTCTIISRPFTIVNVDEVLTAPAYDDLIIPRYSGATLRVKNHSTGIYKLYTDASGATINQQNESGIFTIPSVKSDMTFYIQQSLGNCSSPLVPVSIKVVDKSFFAIPNAFTPNNDRLNDRLPVKIMGYLTLINFQIFNRWGQMIFQTKNLNDGWDGKWKGVIQPAGTYVWIAAGKDINGNIIRDKGSFVLIR